MEALFADYMKETYAAAWRGSATAFIAAVERNDVHIAVALNVEQLTGFIAWTRGYDLHHCVSGGFVIDAYVKPGFRGHGIAVALAAATADQVHRSGGVFLRTTAVENEAVRKLYSRSATCWETRECNIGGRAFRHLAHLHGKPVREMVTSLPEVSWNFEG